MIAEYDRFLAPNYTILKQMRSFTYRQCRCYCQVITDFLETFRRTKNIIIHCIYCASLQIKSHSCLHILHGIPAKQKKQTNGQTNVPNQESSPFYRRLMMMMKTSSYRNLDHVDDQMSSRKILTGTNHCLQSFHFNTTQTVVGRTAAA